MGKGSLSSARARPCQSPLPRVVASQDMVTPAPSCSCSGRGGQKQAGTSSPTRRWPPYSRLGHGLKPTSMCFRSPTGRIPKDLKWIIMSSRIPATLCYGAQCANQLAAQEGYKTTGGCNLELYVYTYLDGVNERSKRLMA